jgi:hypothetical protein
MINTIQPITVQQAYDGITHSRWWAPWNWWWRKVDDDDGDESPSPEPKTDSRSALPMKNKRRRRLRIVKCDESFSLIFLPEEGNIELELRSEEVQGAYKPCRRALGGGRPQACGLWVDPLWLILAPVFFIYSKNILRKFSGPRTLISAQK